MDWDNFDKVLADIFFRLLALTGILLSVLAVFLLIVLIVKLIPII